MAHSSLRPILLVLLLWIAGLGAAIQFSKIAVPFAEFRMLYPDVGTGAGWMLSIISLIGIFMGMTASIFAAKLGFVRVLLFALLLGALMSFWQALLPSFSVMLISRLIEGISHLIVVVVAPTLIAQLSSDRFRGLAMTLWGTFFGVAFALVAWLGLPFVNTYGLSALFVWHGIYMLAVMICLAGAFYVFKISVPQTDSDLDLKSILKRHVTAFKSPSIFAPGIGWLFYTMTFVSLLAILPDTVPIESRATLVGISPLVSIVSSLVIVPILLTRMSAVQVIVLGFSLAVLLTALALTPISKTSIWIVLFAVLGLVQGASFAAVPELNQSAEDRALSNGAMAQMGNLGNTVGTPILLIVLARFDVQGVFLAVALIYICGIGGHLALARCRTTS